MHAVLFVYQRAFTPELIIQRPVRIRVGSPEFLRIVLTRPVGFFYRLLTKTPLPQPHVRSGRHYGNLLPSSPIAASILRKAGYTSKWIQGRGIAAGKSAPPRQTNTCDEPYDLSRIDIEKPIRQGIFGTQHGPFGDMDLSGTDELTPIVLPCRIETAHCD